MKSIPLLVVFLVLAICPPSSQAGEPAPAPHFQEVLLLLRAHLPGVTDEQLDRAAIEGFIRSFQPRVQWVTNETSVLTNLPPGEVGRSAVYFGHFAYLRVVRVGPGLNTRFKAALDALGASNKLSGLVIDLRFATGFDFEAAGRLAATLVNEDRPLLNWGDTRIRSEKSAEAWTLPVVILVNAETAGAPEALAAALRAVDRAVIVGRPTAGQARVFRDFDLGSGQSLRIATEPIQAGEGETLDRPLAPDIVVEVPRDRELVFMDDPYRAEETVTGEGRAAANSRPRRRINEAELVRLRREGQDPDAPGAASRSGLSPASAESLVQDPALARGLDLLKGITLLGAPAQAR